MEVALAPVAFQRVYFTLTTALMCMVIRLCKRIALLDDATWDQSTFIVHVSLAAGASVTFQVIRRQHEAAVAPLDHISAL